METEESEKSVEELMRDYQFQKDNTMVDVLKEIREELVKVNANLEDVKRNTSLRPSPS